ncbi:MAG: DNA-processing protein DprA [Alistipes sp.]
MTIEDIALTMTSGVGVKGAVHLLEVFGDAQHIFAATFDELVGRAVLREDVARSILRREAFAVAEKELAYCARHGIVAVASTDAAYPVLLREVIDYPAVLYVLGNVEVLSAHCVSLVGTREATTYGQDMCHRLVRGLAARVPNLCIVSGLAFGIDVASHRAALAADVPTVGVLANPLPKITPAQHTPVGREIVEKGGALITELHSQVKQTGDFYLARNRIIAALSEGTIIVESPCAGGSLMTAHCADGYNRSLMAVPGRASDQMSLGTNLLIRNRKAQLVLSADDVIAELMWDVHVKDVLERPRARVSELTTDEAGLLGCFRTDDPLSTGELGVLSGLDAGALSVLLLGLELAGAVRQLPGNRYEKKR